MNIVDTGPARRLCSLEMIPVLAALQRSILFPHELAWRYSWAKTVPPGSQVGEVRTAAEVWLHSSVTNLDPAERLQSLATRAMEV